MKELSIEEKAQRYDEAIKRVEDIRTGECEITFMFTKGLFEYIFPELKESENEKIRKALMKNLKERFGTKGNMGEGLDMPDVLAWLEKQGEQKPAWSEEDRDYYDAIIAKLEVTQDDASLTDNQMEFLKSIKDRIIPQSKQEWSEEDELHIRELERLVKQVWAIAEHENDKDTIHKMSDLSFFLKTLKPQLKHRKESKIWTIK